jgi:hypothetical protein
MAEKEIKKTAEKTVMKGEEKKCFLFKRVSTLTGTLIILAALAIAVGIGLIVCL